MKNPLNYKEKSFKVLSKEEIVKLAPQVYSESPMPFSNKGYSINPNKYKFISTYQLIDDLATLGWKVVDAKSVKNSTGKSDYVKHLLIFRNENISLNNETETVWPQLLLTNSHDGTTPFTFDAGLFRLVCSNGLVLADQIFASKKIRHIKYNYNELQSIVFELLKSVDHTLNIINIMTETVLNKKQIETLAKKALSKRLGLKSVKELSNYQIDLSRITSPKRNEDIGNTLWQVFNVIQENIIKGGFTYSIIGETEPSKIKTMKKINAISRSISLNKELFEMATELI